MMRFLKSTLLLSALLFTAHGAFAAETKKPEPQKAKTKNPMVVLDTSMGKIKVEIFADKSPITAANFLKYVDDKFYDGLIFHRVIKGFVIQGGGLDANMKEKANRPPIKNEASNGLKNEVGTLSMARTSDPDSATSQFFISLGDNTRSLDYVPGGNPGYAVFGKVVEGMDVVNRIGDVKTTSKGMMQDVPETPVVIKSATRAK